MSVVVLLSTYNGGDYIETLIQSLLNQNYDKLRIYIRDDGSTDRTREILFRFADENSHIHCRYEENTGVTNSFFDLLKNCGDSFDYYSFCDQDDFWQQNKISCAIKQMELSDPEIPLLYFSRLEYVDDKLNHVGYSAVPKRITFEHAIVENLATGCTVVINRSARNLLLSHLPEFALMHDWWIFLVISALGKIIYDPEPKILYRQHSSNVVGGSTNRFKANYRRLVPFLTSAFNPVKKRTSDQVAEFRRLYGDKLNSDQVKFINDFLSAKESIIQRLRLIASGKYRRQNLVDDLVFSILIVLGYY